ncbi:MAG: Asp-tRNA(Asn)/Glu-tRNA(Gln) amidotransferase subunit GatB [Crenarchaeota archaeon]|nr:MAG: Asp-tRNA(Asn)/Glu-tRNA(Gln) amidotransferase subunit GatB [Thermoproteota archaeon]RDJ34174.1 MAG: Asp-tRNA(Asn)/Glu-tRNA(Gln) amidotransferase subunit GatB [Thermoproteota archaeon]RDJ36711.1 MAG: Asp-tRNA(Asn)/Glu-tRNA(Gln) amidotransferase subunit GatB [Thermoproteota archaeon]RDJ37756.1 MAG: Asp-tRNA(Asn)/Glu-tRNA(Gln) amidotransferase subunit GatB [Thermoproteota archaeon]
MTKIGLEIHCQLTKLNSKLFCSCKADYREFEPNTNICPICMGLPGSLPRLNQKAVEKATTIALALSCQVPEKIAFFRKNYFYPDLPKNFQITQLNVYGPTSIGEKGMVNVEDKEIRIRRIQLEEDPGRLIYEGTSEKTQITLVDYNRAGTPLVEIVTEPDFDNPKQVRIFLNILSDLLENLGVSEPTLEGAMRADGNVSIENGPKVEIKNIGSFHDLEKALHFEITRQESLSSRDIPIAQETRHWDDRRKVTVSARTKEEEMDYRYFPEGDIPWIKIADARIQKLKEDMPESISSKKQRYVTQFDIPPQVADVLSSDKFYSDLFEKSHDEKNAKDIANLITTDLMGLVDTREKREQSKLKPNHLQDLVSAIQASRITRTSAKTALQEMVKSGKSLEEIIKDLDLGKSDEGELEKIVDEVISQETKAVEEAKANPQTINYLVGKVMQKTKGKADPIITLELFKKKLS